MGFLFYFRGTADVLVVQHGLNCFFFFLGVTYCVVIGLGIKSATASHTAATSHVNSGKIIFLILSNFLLSLVCLSISLSLSSLVLLTH